MEVDDLNSFKERLGIRIEKLRITRGFKVREFALIACMEHHQLINIEKGRVDMRLSTLLKISKGLSIDINQLLTFE